MNRLIPAVAAAVFCLAARMSYAQDANKGPGMMGPGGPHRGMMKPCSQEPDPAKCEANRKQMRENMKAAHEACKDKADRRACMTEQMCSKAQDRANCLANAKERHAKMSRHMDERQAAHEACTGKRGEELMKCLHDRRAKRHGEHKSEKKG